MNGARLGTTLAAVMLSACGGAAPDIGGSLPPGPVVVDGVTTFIGDHETGGDTPMALIVGTVTVVEGCLVVVEPDGADGSVPLFPQGTAVEAGPDGPVIRTPVGELTVGDEVGLGGGFIGGLDDDLGDCEEVMPSGGYSVFSVQQDPQPGRG